MDSAQTQDTQGTEPARTAGWAAAIADREGKGLLHRPGSLAGLAAARRANLGQFMTPQPVVDAIWRLLGDTIAACPGKIALFDPSAGTGRMFHPAQPDRFALYGAEIDPELAGPLAEAADAAGFDGELLCADMAEIRVSGMGICLTNPPYSLRLSSVNLTPNAATVYGDYGPDTAASSHAYALALAVDAASVTVAVLPRGFVDEVLADPHYRGTVQAVIHLPRGSFRQAGTEVDTSLVLLCKAANKGQAPAILTPATLDEIASWPALPCHSISDRAAKLRRCRMDTSKPVITRAVTGDNRVRLQHQGRKILLGFRCGLTEALVRNAVAHAFVTPGLHGDDIRLPVGVTYSGHYLLDIEAHMIQDDPLASLGELSRIIRAAGGAPDPAPGFIEHMRRRARRASVEKTPMRHRIEVGEGARLGTTIDATAKTSHLVVPTDLRSPLIRAGQVVPFEAVDGAWVATVAGVRYELSHSELRARFDVDPAASAPTSADDGWLLLHEGRAAAFPQRAAAVWARFRASGADTVASWTYQGESVVAMMLTRGAVGALQMALGKTRMAVALVLAGGGARNAICTESRLIPEFVEQLQGMDISPDEWQVVTSEAQARSLRRINLVSYESLRKHPPGAPRRTIASVLRRKLHTVVADEGTLLRNTETDQSRALWKLSPKRRYVLAGEIISNHMRDALGTLAWACGHATVMQPYGLWGRPFLSPGIIRNASLSMRGMDAFRDAFVTTEWVTAEFRDRMVGGKREIPRLNSPGLYRDWVSRCVLRRRKDEPGVREFFPNAQEPRIEVRSFPWAPAHLRSYIRAADEFAAWWRQRRAAETGRSENKLNMIATLVRVGALAKVASVPQCPPEGIVPVVGMVPKQEGAIEQAVEWAAEGHKTILFVQFQATAQVMARALEARGLDVVVYTGRTSIKARSRALSERFRNGSAQVLIASYKVARKGLNIPQASRVGLLDRDWSDEIERQAIHRVLRQQQTRQVEVVAFHTEGSVDDYQAQMTRHKRAASASGVDHIDAENEEFLHIDQILNDLVDNLARLRGTQSFTVRQELKELAA